MPSSHPGNAGHSLVTLLRPMSVLQVTAQGPRPTHEPRCRVGVIHHVCDSLVLQNNKANPETTYYDVPASSVRDLLKVPK